MKKTLSLFGYLIGLVWGLTFAEPTSPHGWKGAQQFENDAIEIIVVPEIGRLLHLSVREGKNLLNVPENTVGKAPPEDEGDWINYGGDWVWAGSSIPMGKMSGAIWPPLRVLEHGQWEIDVSHKDDGSQTISLRRELGAPVNLKIERHFELGSGRSPTLKVTQKLTRTQQSIYPVTLWQIAQLANPEWVAMASDPSDFEGKRYTFIMGEDPGKDHVLFTETALIFNSRILGELKIGTKGNWIAGRVGNNVLTLEVSEIMQEGQHPDQGSRVVSYANEKSGYAEIETQSKEVYLAPGETIENQVIYQVWTVDETQSAIEILKEIIPDADPTKKRDPLP